MDIENQEIPVKIQWGKQKLDFNIDVNDDIETLKAKLYSLTFVPPEKQKILFKGKTLKEDTILCTLKITKNAVFMLMGTAEGKETVDLSKMEKKVFLEDLNPEQKAKYYKDVLGEILPAGLVNLGNTCYLNSTLQVFRRIPELKSAITSGQMYQSAHGALCNALKELFIKLDTAGDALEPYEFLNFFFGAFPAFAEKGEHGGFQQQDADECFQSLLTVMDPVFPNKTGGSLIEELFGFSVKFEWKNTEDENEPATTNFETMRRLPCIIDNQASPVN